MKYFKRKWDESRGDEYDNWGCSWFYFETDDSGLPIRQIEEYDNGVVLKYSNERLDDKYGMLGDQELDLVEFKQFEITPAEFEKEWNKESRTFVVSKVIGVLFQNEQFEDWWESDLIKVPFFDNKKLKITFMDFIPRSDQSFIDEADKALENFLLKGKIERTEYSDLVYKNCMEFLNAVEYDEADKPLRDIKEKVEIWNFVYPQEIYISRRSRRDKDVYISIACECQWEQEHGLQLVFRQGKRITRVSDQDGHLTEADAYDKPDSEDELLSRYDGVGSIKGDKKKRWWRWFRG